LRTPSFRKACNVSGLLIKTFHVITLSRVRYIQESHPTTAV